MRALLLQSYLIATSLLIAFQGVHAVSPIYETYLESWDSNWNTAMRGLPPTPSSSTTNYNNVTLDIAFASYTFPGLNGLQFSSPTEDVASIISYVHSQNGLVKISFGGASYAGPNYFISQTYGWPDNINNLASGVSEVVNTFGFDGVDFDIEDSLPTGTTAEEFANQLFSFLTKVRANLPSKIISLTIPGQGWGTYWKPLAQLVAENKTVDYINFMEYDIWIGAPTYADQIKGDITTYTSPANTSPAPNYASGWGISPSIIQLGLMPGDDDTKQNLSLADAEDLTEFAVANDLFGVMTWDLNRDARTTTISPIIGGSPYDYSNAIREIIYTASLSSTNLFREKRIKKNKIHRLKASDKKKVRKKRSHFDRQRPPHHGATE